MKGKTCREILAENIKKYRKINNMSQEALAEKLNTEVYYISKLENSKREKILIDHIDKLAGIFKISLEKLFVDEVD
jgi:transcriptional regulator with XRE-family HTH domain